MSSGWPRRVVRLCQVTLPADEVVHALALARPPTRLVAKMRALLRPRPLPAARARCFTTSRAAVSKPPEMCREPQAEEPEPEPEHPALRRFPRAAVPYLELARVEKPIGSLLLYWPGAWSIALAAPIGGVPDLRLLGAFGVGALVMRGAG